jgi:ubiquinone/menaquinone biosynthesis C-methylase UbiE
VTGSGYIHGFGEEESRRLWEQAEILAPMVFSTLRLPLQGSLLEIGCGVGAQLNQIAQRCPNLQLTGIDLSLANLSAAKKFLSVSAASSAQLLQANAVALPFPDDSFDTAITIWMLEHVSDPLAVLREAVRVVQPGGNLLCTEVDNATFRFAPELTAIQHWWDLFCTQQSAGGGDPFVGQKLRELAQGLGCEQVSTEELALASSEMGPTRRAELLDYLEELLLSGAAALQKDPQVMAQSDRNLGSLEEVLSGLKEEFAHAKADPTIGFDYHAVQLTCRTPLI